MGTVNIPHSKLLAALEHYRDFLIDADVVVDDAGRAVTAALVDQERARVERDRIAGHLQHLIDLHDELECVAETLGPEIAERHAEVLIRKAVV